MQINGEVEYIGSKPVGRGQAWSIKVNGTFYSCGFRKPPCERGDVVTFFLGKNQRGYEEAQNIQVTGRGEPQYQNQQYPNNQFQNPRQQPRQAPQQRGSAVGKDDYWANKEARDVEVQKAIQFQASRNAAIETVSILLSNDAVSLGTTKAKKLDIVVALIDELTDKFNKDVTDFVQGNRQVAAVGEDDTSVEVDNEFDDDVPF